MTETVTVYRCRSCNYIDEVITDAAGFNSYKLPQDEANRIERLLKSGSDSDIDSDEELVENEEVSYEDLT